MSTPNAFDALTAPRLVQAVPLNPPRVMHGEDMSSYALALVARPVGAEIPAEIVSGTIAGAIEHEPGVQKVWFRRALQYTHRTVVNGPGDAYEETLAHTMGGNICTTPEPMRLHRFNNPESVAPGDHGHRARPYDVLEITIPAAEGKPARKRRFLITEAHAHGHAPDVVNYHPEEPPPAQLRLQGDTRFDLGAIIPAHENEQWIEHPGEVSSNLQGLFEGIGARVRKGADVTPMTRVLFRPKVNGGWDRITPPFNSQDIEAKAWLPANADLGAGLRYWFDPDARAYVFGEDVVAYEPDAFYATIARATLVDGHELDYRYREDAALSLPLILDGAGSGLGTGTTVWPHRVALAVETYGAAQLDITFELNALWFDGTSDFIHGFLLTNTLDRDATVLAVEVSGTPSVYTMTGNTAVARGALTASTPTAPYQVRFRQAGVGSSTWEVYFRQLSVPEAVGAPPPWPASPQVTVTGFALGPTVHAGAYARGASALRFTPGQQSPRSTGTMRLIRGWLPDGTTGGALAVIDAVGPRPFPLEDAFDRPVRRKVTLPAGHTLTVVVNDTSGSTMTHASPARTRDTYFRTGGELIFPMVTGNDALRIVMTPPPASNIPPGPVPAMPQAIANFAGPGTDVNAHRANWFDYVLVDLDGEAFPASPAGLAATIRRDPCFLPRTVAVDWAERRADGAAPAWQEIPAESLRVLAVDGLVLVATDWVMANLPPGRIVQFRLRGSECQRTRRFDANSFNRVVDCYAALDQAWLNIGSPGGMAPGFSMQGRMQLVYPTWKKGTYSFISTEEGYPTSAVMGMPSGALHDYSPDVRYTPAPPGMPEFGFYETYGWDYRQWPRFESSTFRWAGASLPGANQAVIVLPAIDETDTDGAISAHDFLGIDGGFVWSAAEADPGTFVASSGHMGTGPDAPEPVPSLEFQPLLGAQGIGAGLGAALARFSDAVEILEAWAEVSVPVGATIATRTVDQVWHTGNAPELEERGYELRVNGTLVRRFWEVWSPGWVTAVNESATIPPDATSAPLAFALIATRRHTRVVRSPDKNISAPGAYLANLTSDNYTSLGVSLSATFAAGQTKLMDVTALVRALVADRNSANDPNGYFLYPVAGVTSAPGMAAAPGLAGVLRSMVPDVSIELFESTEELRQIGLRTEFTGAQTVSMSAAPSISRVFVRLRDGLNTQSLTVPLPVGRLL